MCYLTKMAKTILGWDCRKPECKVLLLATARELLVLAEAQALLKGRKMDRLASPVSKNSVKVQEFVDRLQRTERDLDEILQNIESIQSGKIDVAVEYPTIPAADANRELVSMACIKLASLASVASEIGEETLAENIDDFLSRVLGD